MMMWNDWWYTILRWIGSHRDSQSPHASRHQGISRCHSGGFGQLVLTCYHCYHVALIIQYYIFSVFHIKTWASNSLHAQIQVVREVLILHTYSKSTDGQAGDKSQEDHDHGVANGNQKVEDMDVTGGNEQAGDQEELVELWGDSFGNAALEIQENHAGSQEVKEKWVDFHRFPQATSGWEGRRPSLRHDCQWEGETRRSSTSSLVAWCCPRFVPYIPHQWRWKTTGMLWWRTVRKRLMRLEQSD